MDRVLGFGGSGAPSLKVLAGGKMDSPKAPLTSGIGGDSSPTPSHADLREGHLMVSPSRSEMDARLEAVEARMDARISSMSSKLDATLAEIKADRVRFAHVESSMADMRNDIKASAKETVAQTSSLKTTIVVTAIATVIGLWGANIALLGGMRDSFSAGKDQGKSDVQISQEMRDLKEQMKAVQEALDRYSRQVQQSK